MTHVRSVTPTPLLEAWLKDIEKTIDEADFWVSAGEQEHWLWSLQYMQVFEEGCTYWGTRISADNLRDILQADRRGMVGTTIKFWIDLASGQKPNIVFFYVNNIGIIGAGLVIQCEFDFLNLFWPSEKKRGGQVEFPFRFKMRVIWLTPETLAGKLSGDPDLTEILKNYTRSGLQHVAESEIIENIRSLLKEKVAEYKKLELLHAVGNLLEKLTDEGLSQVLERKGLFLEQDVVKQVVAALKGGKHLLLVGPPGTGKTSLARAIAEACGMNLVEKTASGEWSRVDVIGGPVFIGGEVHWRSGALVEALAMHIMQKGALLLIDEINRANMDRAFGEFFTIFGGEPGEWMVPESLLREMEVYRERGKIDHWGRVLLERWEERKKSGRPASLEVPKDFRIIATMNVYDRRYLFTLGYALLRRFAVVEVGNPSENTIRENILPKHCNNEKIVEEVFSFYKELKNTGFELGVALLIDVTKLACNVTKEGMDPKALVDTAVKMVVVPQLEGLMPVQLKAVKEILSKRGYENSLRFFQQLYPEVEAGEREQRK